MNRLKVIFVRSNPVMPDPRVEKEANSLLELGYDVGILAWNRNTDSEKTSKYGTIPLERGTVPIRWFNVRATFGGGIRNIFSLVIFLLLELGWLIKHRREYDVIHACDFDTVIPAFICSKLFGKKYVYDIFDYYVDAYSVPTFIKPLIEKIDIFMIGCANAVIIVNESRYKQIEKSNPKKLFVIHNSPDIKYFQHNESQVIHNESTKPKFVYVGILSEGRMLKEIIEVFEKTKEWELHIGGFGELEEYIKGKANNNTNILFYGKIPYKTTLKLESQCDALFAVYDPSIPNHKYSSPNKFYEAMILGKPIIVAEGTGIDKIVKAENLGKTIPYTKEALLIACRDVVSEIEQNVISSKAMVDLYNKKYSWNIMRDRLKELYNGIKRG